MSATCCSIFLSLCGRYSTTPSLFTLQILLHACEEELYNPDMYVNTKKSVCIRVGRRFTQQCAKLVTASGERLRLADRCRYLGVYFISGCSLRC